MPLHIAVGCIQLKPTASRLRFTWHAMFAYLQARRVPGNVYVSLHGEKPSTYWSLSVWQTPEAMREYRNTGAHARAMKVATEMAERIDFRHWEADVIPSWDEVLRVYRQNSGGR